MAKRGTIIRSSADDLRATASRVGDRTDWARVDATAEAEIDRQAAEDGTLLPDGWQDTAIIGLPPPKQHINLRIDADVLGWFKGTGKGYQTRINNVLRAFVASRTRSAG